MNHKSPAEKIAFRKLHPNWGGGNRNQGRKPTRITFRHLDGRFFTPAETKRIETAMLKFDCHIAKS